MGYYRDDELILTPEDLNGQTISQIDELIENGWELNGDAQYCLDVAKRRVIDFADAWMDRFIEQIHAIYPPYFENNFWLEKEIRFSVERHFTDEAVRLLENSRKMKFPTKGLRGEDIDLIQNIVPKFHIFIISQLAPWIDSIKVYVKRDGYSFFDTLPTAWGDTSYGFSLVTPEEGPEQRDLLDFKGELEAKFYEE